MDVDLRRRCQLVSDTKRVTRRDVAKRAGVAESTVSFVVNGRSMVSPETRAKVVKAIDELGYMPNLMARNLRANRSTMIAVIIPDMRNPFFGGIVQGFERVASENGYTVVVMGPGRGFELTFRACVEGRMAAVVSCMGGQEPGDIEPLRRSGIPFITCLYQLPGDPGIPHILSDFETGIAQAVEHLHALGHRHIGLIPGPTDSRIGIWKRLTEAAGISIQVLGEVGLAYDGIGTLAQELLSSGVTAAAALNDIVPLALCSQLAALGKSVPGSLSVIGHDDSWLAEFSTPPMTSIRLFETVLGERAAEMAIALAGGGKVESVGIPTELVIRGSTGPPR